MSTIKKNLPVIVLVLIVLNIGLDLTRYKNYQEEVEAYKQLPSQSILAEEIYRRYVEEPELFKPYNDYKLVRTAYRVGLMPREDLILTPTTGLGKSVEFPQTSLIISEGGSKWYGLLEEEDISNELIGVSSIQIGGFEDYKVGVLEVEDKYLNGYLPFLEGTPSELSILENGSKQLTKLAKEARASYETSYNFFNFNSTLKELFYFFRFIRFFVYIVGLIYCLWCLRHSRN